MPDLTKTLAAALTLMLLSNIAQAGFNTNLIVNAGAEAGQGSTDGSVVPVPGWTTVGNFTVVTYGAGAGFPASTDPGPPARGLNFFAGGPSNASSGASQLINESADASIIDAGGVSFNLSGYLGGFDGQRDNAAVTATFLGSGSTTLGSASIGPVSVGDRNSLTGLLFRNTSGAIPIGTRTISINIQMTRLDGDYNDGYADNLSLVLQSQAVPEPASVLTLGLGLSGVAVYSARGRKRAA